MIEKSTFTFLRNLKKNNNREWFNSNKHLYESAKSNFLAFLDILIMEIQKFDKSVSGINAKDCLFRIYRDVRFSKDKIPYKFNLGAVISKGGKKFPYPCYYVHVEPNHKTIVAVGVWHPPSDILYGIRQHISTHSKKFHQIIDNKNFKDVFGTLWGDRLKKAPKDFDPNHADIELLKYKDFLGIKDFKEGEATSQIFIDKAAGVLKTGYKLNEFIAESMHIQN